MIRIQIQQATLREIPYVDKKTGANKVLYAQTAYFHVVDAEGTPGLYPEKGELLMPRGRTTPFPAGEYTLHPSAIYVDQRGRPSLDATRLTPIKPAASAAPAR